MGIIDDTAITGQLNSITVTTDRGGHFEVIFLHKQKKPERPGLWSHRMQSLDSNLQTAPHREGIYRDVKINTHPKSHSYHYYECKQHLVTS